MKAMNFQDDFSSFLLGDSWVMPDATRNCHFPELVCQQRKIVLTFSFPMKHSSDHFVLEECSSLVAVRKFGVDEKSIWEKTVVLLQISNRIFLLGFPFPGSIPSEFAPNIAIDVCHQRITIEQNVARPLDKVCWVLSWNIFCRLLWT